MKQVHQDKNVVFISYSNPAEYLPSSYESASSDFTAISLTPTLANISCSQIYPENLSALLIFQ